MCGRGSERGGIAEVDNKMGLLKKKSCGGRGDEDDNVGRVGPGWMMVS